MFGTAHAAVANMDKQGFGDLDATAKSRYAFPLRFTPGVGTALVVVGLIWQSPVWLAAVAVTALSGAVLPRAMFIDLVYNFGVRHLFGAPPLSPTPTPRRFSYVLSATLWQVRLCPSSTASRRWESLGEWWPSEHDSHRLAVVSWFVVLQADFRARRSR